ncbi:MAG TPA: isoprenylcysteine carboxylmethyltransferase family protein [Candidatus Acidoferrum sp.]|nr:isoprenylcysteine carboxylmethyltransferase family protein [Candidatus Acidoferrum sp.]
MNSATISLQGQAPRQKNAAALLASAWCLPAAAFAGIVAARLGFWADANSTAFLLGSPVVLLLGRAIFWGWLLAFFSPELNLALLLAVGLAGDLLLLHIIGITPQANILFWLVELLTLAFCLLPAQLFARWTREDSHLTSRNVLHILFHAALILGVWPLLAVDLFGGNWHAWSERSSALNKIYLQLLCIPGVFLLTAMQEFHAQGRGTPMPQDAPRKLVITGIYAYVANPMQVGKFGVLAGWGCFWKNPYIVVIAFLGLFYSLTIARLREDRDLTARFGEDWFAYRRHVRRWLPRWRPWIPSTFAQEPHNGNPVQESAAVLYLDFDCGPCANLMRWFLAQKPVGLRIASRVDYPGAVPSAILYRHACGAGEERGIAAMARALEHIHLAWAFFAWMLRLPFIAWFAQLLADAAAPRELQPCSLPLSPILSIPPEPGSPL